MLTQAIEIVGSGFFIKQIVFVFWGVTHHKSVHQVMIDFVFGYR